MRRDCFACRDDVAEFAGMPVLATLPAERIMVVSSPHDTIECAISTECRPVYAFSRDAPPAIPTGRVFVQSAKGVNLAETLEPLNYEIESVPPYAANVAWIVASDGSIASALSNLHALMAANGIESVEPQMLRPATYRSVD